MHFWGLTPDEYRRIPLALFDVMNQKMREVGHG